MTCKECPHFDVCIAYGVLVVPPQVESKWKNCPFRNDKDIFVELPYAIGTKVFVIRSLTSNNKNLYITEDFIEGYRISRDHIMMTFDVRLSMGDWQWDKIFTTREEAEAKLKELNENET